MGHEAVPDDVLDKVQEILSKAGMQPMPHVFSLYALWTDDQETATVQVFF
jgi:hypothetical protein